MPSYADSVRSELLEVAVKRPCCKRALLCGLLLEAGKVDKQISVTYKHPLVAELAAGDQSGHEQQSGEGEGKNLLHCVYPLFGKF